jgi:pseudaminic acid synthase
MVESIRKTEKALGKVNYHLSEENKQKRRSLFVSQDIKAGEIASMENIRSVRSGAGLHPKYFYEIIGMKSKRFINKGEPVKLEDFIK